MREKKEDWKQKNRMESKLWSFAFIRKCSVMNVGSGVDGRDAKIDANNTVVVTPYCCYNSKGSPQNINGNRKFSKIANPKIFEFTTVTRHQSQKGLFFIKVSYDGSWVGWGGV